jgi:N-acyl homoserine lactone hydrolase
VGVGRKAVVFEIHTLRLGELTDGKTRILVDSGMPDAAEVAARLKVAGREGGRGPLRASLASTGATPESIDYVLLTHLHFDHAWNLDLFPNACVIVQREELFNAIDPVATQRIYYLKETLIGLLHRKHPARLRLVDGDLDLVSGLSLMKTPGHTPGMQVVIVTTAKGRVALVSDLGDHHRNWHPADLRATDKPMRFLAWGFLPGSRGVLFPSMTHSARTPFCSTVPASGFLRVPRSAATGLR